MIEKIELMNQIKNFGLYRDYDRLENRIMAFLKKVKKPINLKFSLSEGHIGKYKIKLFPENEMTDSYPGLYEIALYPDTEFSGFSNAFDIKCHFFSSGGFAVTQTYNPDAEPGTFSIYKITVITLRNNTTRDETYFRTTDEHIYKLAEMWKSP